MIGYDDVVSGDSPENKSAISENRCPECQGHGAVATYDLPSSERVCLACGGTGRKKPAEKLRDSVPGQESLPADLIDRAVEIAAPVWREGCYDERDLGEVLEAAAPLLVEHGRRQALKDEEADQ